MSAEKTSIDPGVRAALQVAYPDLDAATAHTLMEMGCVADIPAGQRLFTGSEQCRGVMWLLEGSVRIHRCSADGREVTLYRVTPGDLCILSLYQLFHSEHIFAEAHAETRLKGVVVPAQAMLALLDENPVIRHQLLRYLTGRLQELGLLVGETVFNRLEMRLGKNALA